MATPVQLKLHVATRLVRPKWRDARIVRVQRNILNSSFAYVKGGRNLTTSMLPRKSQNLLFLAPEVQMFRTTPMFGITRDHNRKRLKTRTEIIDL